MKTIQELLRARADRDEQKMHKEHPELSFCGWEPSHFMRKTADYIDKLEDDLVKQTNRAALAELQVKQLNRRLDMANRLNTDARNELARLKGSML